MVPEEITENESKQEDKVEKLTIDQYDLDNMTIDDRLKEAARLTQKARTASRKSEEYKRLHQKYVELAVALSKWEEN